MRGLTRLMGSSTTFNEDIKGFYHEPLKEYDFDKNIRESNFNASIDDLKRAFQVANGEIQIDDVEERDKTQYFNESGRVFYGKDGAGDAYVKKGIDADLVSYFERQETEKRTWRMATSTTHIDFKSGGKVFIGGREWVILKVINQLSTNDIENNLKARSNMSIVETWGAKILILA